MQWPLAINSMWSEGTLVRKGVKPWTVMIQHQIAGTVSLPCLIHWFQLHLSAPGNIFLPSRLRFKFTELIWVPWSSSHTEWMATAALDCDWLAWSTSAQWVWCGCGQSRPLLKTNHLSPLLRGAKILQSRGHKAQRKLMPCSFVAKSEAQGHSYTNICSLETLLQSNEVKNIPVKKKKKRDIESMICFCFFLSETSTGSTACSCCFQKRLTDGALYETYETSTVMPNIPMGKSASLLEQDVKRLWYFYLSICEMDFNLELVYRFNSTMCYQGLPLLLKISWRFDKCV